MPKYFFDVDDGRHQVRDEVGSEHADKFAAAQEGESLLKTVHDIQVIEGRPGSASVRVRDANGKVVHEASGRPEG